MSASALSSAASATGDPSDARAPARRGAALAATVRADIDAALTACRQWLYRTKNSVLPIEDIAASAGGREGDQGVCLQLPATHGLVQRLSLPGSARRHLDNIIENKIRALTPFEPEDVYFGYSSTAAGSGALAVTLAAAPKDTCAQAVATATKKGFKVTAVAIAGATEINIAPTALCDNRYKNQSLQRLLKINAVLLASAFLVVFGGGAARLIWAEALARDAGSRATEALEARTEALALQKKAEPIYALQRKNLALGAVLNGLAANVSDDAWFDRVTIDAEKVDLQGYATAASDVLATVDAMPAIEEAAFRASVTRDTTSGQERFQIRARLKATP